jgi:hypothetical protein
VEARVEVVAPEGFAPGPAEPRAVEGPWGSLARRERVEGRTLVREERLVLARGRIPPERYADFAAFAASVDHVQERPAAFLRTGPAAEPAGAAGPAPRAAQPQ